ncbi:Alg9-like mannosyltransferase family-domain-containing protein [Lipomyces tetrasporus]|uniref:Mannosyltransferase n=1 Tax=Lipomyces tetrasporus TaxID=54092 RepID=A0AAD7QXB4_9ASCO|nr:Alg9-like mannosyltransferase family-domain-containing protein [Lipomyces tetrasporus]KAJ8102621.1 Alg9-like mannosyltransferase family-domain-containing protein [Lipomyces tetrasporus]
MSWRLAYLLLLLVRFYFTLSPSYIHPDEHFQGPEVLAGDIFGWNVTKAWEFTTDNPIRSILPLWLAYGFPMTILRWMYGMSVNPILAYYCLRMFFFLISFSLEDWALQELASTPKVRAHYLLVVASSYVTWTYQTHTFSNSVETIILAWTLVLIRRISFRNFGHTRHFWSCCLLGCLVAIGVFNRITFPAFLILPVWYLVPQFIRFPSSIIFIVLSGIGTSLVAIYIDTRYYGSPTPVLTPLNNFMYNFQPENLAKHGLHPRYTHILVNLPLLLGPYVLFVRPQLSIAFLSAVSGTIVLSLFQHQEARFLLPAIPLLLASTSIPKFALSTTSRKWMLISVFGVFNAILAAIFGIYHQGGIVPAQTLYIGPHASSISDVVWWKTYSPPDWLLGEHEVGFIHRGGVRDASNISTLIATDKQPGIRVWDMMGSHPDVISTLLKALAASALQRTGNDQGDVLLVAPMAAKGLYKFQDDASFPFYLKLEWMYSRHVNLDDIGVDYDEVMYNRRRLRHDDVNGGNDSNTNDYGGGDDHDGLELRLWDKAKLMISQNRPGLGVWTVSSRDFS